jgi:hypothetical protein
MIKDTKVSDTQQAPDGRVYYYDGLNYVLPLCFEYRNWSNKTSERTVIPFATFYGTTEYYTTKTWLLNCWDCDKNDWRTFAFSNIVRFL